MQELPAAVRRAFDPAVREEFERRVDRQAGELSADVRAGRLDNESFAVGLELEAYTTDADGRLVPVPEAVFERTDAGVELGVHDLELHTAPDTLDPAGLTRQRDRLRESVTAVRAALPEDRRLALDALFAIPPTEGTDAYLRAVTDHDGVVVADRMHPDARYVALDNETLRRAGGAVRLSVPGVDRTFPSILVESLATSMQPHLQIPRAADLPAYHDYAVRTMGPVLALATNSPFLPADLYRDPETGALPPAETVLSGPHEHRVYVFEQSVNAGLAPDERKVRVPEDLERATDVPRRVAADPTFGPTLFDDADRTDAVYSDRFPEYEHARGSHWRWVRAVLGGSVPTGPDGAPAPGNDDRSVRLEYRPLPTQPSIPDTIAFQALVAGLLRELVAREHPLAELPWAAARDSFYAAVDDGPAADLAWVDADGDRVTDTDAVFAELLALAEAGLCRVGCSDAEAERLLAPVAARAETRATPSTWKRERAREAVDDGEDVETAVVAAQRAYLERADPAVPFAEWG